MKRFSLVIVILLAVQFVFAQNAPTTVSNKEAMTYGLNYMKSQYPTRANLAISSYELLKSEKTGKDCYHVFNFENGGFVIVCADLRGTPILGYSDEGSFDFENGAPATREWIQHYMQQLDVIEAKNIAVSEKNIAAWNPTTKRSNTRGVSAMLQTKWNQTYPFNMLCPEHSQGDHGHTYTGCVATAMAQVMKYWNYPQHGIGEVSYFWGAWDTINLAEATYDWNNMPNSYSAFGTNAWSDEQKQAVATLMLHCGVSISMDYGYEGSGTQTFYVADALRYNFGYRNGVNYKYRDNGATDDSFEHYYENDTIWSRMLIEDLDMHRPLIYSGHPSSGAGHAWVCDGYRTNNEGTTEFHMNWGWGGSNDGYYTIDNLNTHAGPGDDGSNNFIYGQCVIFNIAVPDLDAAPFCMNDQTNVYEEEHWDINDGSYSNYYKKNTNCDWVIKINDYQHDTVMLHFNYFELESGDEVKIYAGENSNGQLLGTYYDGNEPVDTIKHVGTPLYIVFTTDGENQARGWELHYEALRYPYTITTSVVGNGGTVSPEGVIPVMKNSNKSITMIPNSGYSVSEFTIDGTITLKGAGMGEEIGYTFTNIKKNHTIEVKFGPVSVDSETADGISIFPNPNNGKFSLNLGENNTQSYILYDMSGRVVEEKDINGLSSVDFDMNISAGTYFIKIIAGDKVSVEKIIVE
ncbi:MAG: C10 family peptidase [Bacteroidales bacterium]|nr:C10 family peptidase [Bacteroidales bacterium]